MDRKEQLAVGRRLLGHIEGRTTDLADALFRNRVDAYSCRERAASERDSLFRSQPLFMGLSSRLSKPGDYITEDVAGMPFARDAMLANAPATVNGETIKVPQVLPGEGMN